jgi:SPP1 family predicted phage head-tail adaptor
MSLRAGTLRHRITIEIPVRAQDPVSGELVIIEWRAVFTSVPAAIEPLSAREFMSARAMQSQITARIVIRYCEGLTADMRIVHNTTIYNVEGWLPDRDSGREYITAPVSQGVNQG